MLFKLEKKLDNKSRKKMGSNENVAVKYPSLKNLDSGKNSFGGVWPEKKFRTKEFVIEKVAYAPVDVFLSVFYAHANGFSRFDVFLHGFLFKILLV